MHRAVILAILTLLLLAVAGITAAQESGYSPEMGYQTEPTALEETTVGDITDPSGEETVGNSEEPEADSSGVTEDTAAEGVSKGSPRGTGKEDEAGEPGKGEANVAPPLAPKAMPNAVPKAVPKAVRPG